MTAPSTGSWPLERPLAPPRSRPRAGRMGIALALAGMAGGSSLLALLRADPSTIAGRPLIARAEDAVIALGLGLDQVELKGHKLASDRQILDAVGLADARTFLTFDAATARSRVESLPWVQSALIERLYPNRIVVTITERRPFAAWQQGDKDVLVDETGRELTQIARGGAPALPRIAGAGAPQDAARVLALVAAHPDLARRLALAERVSLRRWRLMLSDGRRVELPADAVAAALAMLMDNRAGGRLVDVDAAAIDLTVLRRVVVVPRARNG